MAVTIIDSKHKVAAAGQDAWDGAGDIVVSTTGELVATGGGDGLGASGEGSTIAVAGLVSGYGGAAACGVALAGANQFLTVSGTIKGATGARASGGGDTIAIVAHAAITGTGDGIALVDRADASPDETIANHGTISGGKAGVLDASNGANTIDNAGILTGASAGFLAYRPTGTLTGDIFINEGSVSATSVAVDLETAAKSSVVNSSSLKARDDVIVDHGTSDTIASSGTIDATATAIDVADSTRIAISNTGVVDSKQTAIKIVRSTGVTIASSGQVKGGLISDAASPLTIENSGLWQASAAQGGLSLGAAGNRLTNLGTIDGAIALSASVAAAKAGDNALINQGAIVGAVRFRGAGNDLVNSGEIHGAVTMGTGATIANLGSIVGNVVCGGAGGAVVNNGQIDGVLTMAADATLTNNVLIAGAVKLGVGDSVNDSVGQVTGSIGCAKSDVFTYEGKFGAETLADFVGGAAAGHDVIRVSKADFDGFAAVTKAMSQDGANVVLRLDNSDEITFDGIKLSSLVAKDFKFF